MLEARPIVGGTAASEPFAGATVNICNCDHITFRTTPVMDELDLADARAALPRHGPVAARRWRGRGGPAWQHHHDVERTLDELAATYPGEVDGYRRYLRAARPAVELILAAANEPPSVARPDPHGAVRRRLAGRADAAALEPAQRGRRDAAYFRHDALRRARRSSIGPMVWGISARRRPAPGSAR